VFDNGILLSDQFLTKCVGKLKDPIRKAISENPSKNIPAGTKKSSTKNDSMVLKVADILKY